MSAVWFQVFLFYFEVCPTKHLSGHDAGEMVHSMDVGGEDEKYVSLSLKQPPTVAILWQTTAMQD